MRPASKIPVIFSPKILRQLVCGLLITNFGIFSCGQAEYSPSQDSPSFDFKLQVLHENFVSDTVFEEGENIILSFIIINRSDTKVSLDQSRFQSNDFLRVYKTDSNSELNNSMIDIGRPYRTIFCSYQLGVTIPAHDTLKLSIPWIPTRESVSENFCLLNTNSPLQTGTYQTRFKQNFSFFWNLGSGNESSYTWYG